MAFWYKKQEEQKKLIEDDDITFGNSAWADPKALKNSLLGSGDVKYRPR
jgi:cilia- and flagella-associated protein 298